MSFNSQRHTKDRCNLFCSIDCMMRKNGSNDFLTLYNLNREERRVKHAEEQVKRIISYRLPFSNTQKKERSGTRNPF